MCRKLAAAPSARQALPPPDMCRRIRRGKCDGEFIPENMQTNK
jgi:hypothetical protein